MLAAPPTSTFDASGPGSVFGKYRITGKLGTGGMGIVFAAEHQRLGRRVAIKLLKPEYSSDPMQVRRFQAEARLISRIGHPNIVEVYDFGQLPDGSHYFVMELLDGLTLRQRLVQRPLSDAEIIAVFVPLIAAVQTAHAIGVVHRDLKPDNVMLVPTAEPEAPLVKLMDFGVAAVRSLVGDGESAIFFPCGEVAERLRAQDGPSAPGAPFTLRYFWRARSSTAQTAAQTRASLRSPY